MAKSQAEAKGISDFQHVVDGSKGNSDVFMVPAIHWSCASLQPLYLLFYMMPSFWCPVVVCSFVGKHLVILKLFYTTFPPLCLGWKPCSHHVSAIWWWRIWWAHLPCPHPPPHPQPLNHHWLRASLGSQHISCILKDKGELARCTSVGCWEGFWWAGLKCRCLTERDASGTWGSQARPEEERCLDCSAEGMHLCWLVRVVRFTL